MAKRQAKTLSSIASQIAAAPITNKKNLKQLETLGVDTAEGVTNNALISAGVYMAAASGDMKAVEKWEEWTEASSAAGESSFELPARCIGKAFVDLNRHIEPNRSYIFKGGRGSTKSSYISLKSSRFCVAIQRCTLVSAAKSAAPCVTAYMHRSNGQYTNCGKTTDTTARYRLWRSQTT